MNHENLVLVQKKCLGDHILGVNFTRSSEACNLKLPSKCEESLEVFPADSLTQTSPYESYSHGHLCFDKAHFMLKLTIFELET